MARADEIGMFWQDIRPEGRRGTSRPQPPIPDTGWVTPTKFPNLSTATILAVDTETKDPNLKEKGPGWARNDGHIIGISVATLDNHSWYFPMRHEVEPEYNLPPENVLAWANDYLTTGIPKIGANLTYDVGWLKQEGVDVKGDFYDIQFAESLLEERGRLSLDILGEKYLGMGKETNLLYEWCRDFYGGGIDQRKNLWRAPPRLVGPYAERDATLPANIFPKLYQRLQEENLWELFLMECKLIPLTISMRFNGVRVDTSRADLLNQELKVREVAEQEKLDALVGMKVETTKPASIARAFDELGLPYTRTEKGAPSFTKKFLEDTKNPICDAINEIRKLAKLRGTFVESYILNNHINGRVHGQFHPLRSDEGGTRSGRWASSTPNLQNIPIRDQALAHMVRGLFLPDVGHRFWRKYDYSQIEYRFLIHYAVGKGADQARLLFNQRPDTDYHDMTMDMVGPVAAWDLSTEEKRKQMRRPLKNINFGLIYGMGEDRLSGSLGLSKKEGKELFKFYHEAVPFAKETMDSCIAEVNMIGFITTILGRRSRFDYWEPDQWGTDATPLPYEQAVLHYGQIKRAASHKALNRRLQGSAADMIKAAMLKAYEDGVYDRIGLPLVTVHDELGFSDNGECEDGHAELKHIMENIIPLKVPVKVDVEIGPDWGHVK